MVVYRLLFASKYIFKIEYKSADIRLEFANLMKIKYIGDVFLSVISPEFKFKGKTRNFPILAIFLKI